MVNGFFLLVTPHGTCRVPESLRKFNVPLELFLQSFQTELNAPENLDQVTGISVRAWLCDWKEGEVGVLLGKRAADDSSPNFYEAFGGKCDPKETVLDSLIREFWEETKLEISVIHGEVPEVDVFCTPKSKRWIAQIHFLVSAKPSCGKGFCIKLDPKEHQSFIWAIGKLAALGTLPITQGSKSHFESAVAIFQREMPCPSGQKP